VNISCILIEQFTVDKFRNLSTVELIDVFQTGQG
jgi:hypothetical protein